MPSTPLFNAACAYCKEHAGEVTLNHCLRGVAFSLILLKRFPPFAGDKDIDTEAVMIASILHDMGWAHGLISKDKRFEVDGANIARDFIRNDAEAKGQYDKHRLQLVWDAIALHATASIAHHKEPEVVAVQLGILADFFGHNLPIPGWPITVDDYKEVVTAFPRLGFKDFVKDLFCGFCKTKPETTLDNFVSEYGRLYGLDGNGEGKEEFTKMLDENNFVKRLEGGLTALEQHEN